jgi:hypothetical protein
LVQYRALGPIASYLHRKSREVGKETKIPRAFKASHTGLTVAARSARARSASASPKSSPPGRKPSVPYQHIHPRNVASRNGQDVPCSAAGGTERTCRPSALGKQKVCSGLALIPFESDRDPSARTSLNFDSVFVRRCHGNVDRTNAWRFSG